WTNHSATTAKRRRKRRNTTWKNYEVASRNSKRNSGHTEPRCNGTHSTYHLLGHRLADFFQVQVAALEHHQPGHRHHYSGCRADDPDSLHEHRGAVLARRARDELCHPDRAAHNWT